MLVLAGITGCGAPSEPATPLPGAATLSIAFDGCVAVRRGPRCLVGETGAELTLWIEGPAEPPLEVRVDDVPVPARHGYVEGGQQIHVTVPGPARTLSVRHPNSGAHGVLELGAAPRRSDILHAWTELLRGDGSGAVAASLPVLVRGLVRLRKACFKAGQIDSAVALAGWTIALAEPAGLVSELSEAAQAAAFVRTQLRPRDPAMAARFLAAEAASLPDFPRGQARARYYAGLAAYVSGDLRAALHSFADGERRTRRLGLIGDFVAASAMHTVLLGQIGRSDEVNERVRQSAAATTEIGACDRATMLTNLGFAQLQLQQAGLLADDPVPLLAEGLALSLDECVDAARIDTLRINLALAAFERGDPEDARPLLDELREHAPGATEVVWLAELETRAALLEGRLGEGEDPLLEIDPAELADPELAWPRMLRRAQSLAAWGLRGPAVATLRDAEARLDEQVHALAIDEGREQFMAGRRRSAELLVDLLVDAGQLEQALCAARLARVRTLRAVDRAARIENLEPAARARWDAHVSDYERAREQVEAARRDRWQLVGPALVQHDARAQAARDDMRRALDSAYALLGRIDAAPGCDELPAPAPGELLLLVQPTMDGLIAFAADHSGVAATRLEALDPDDLATSARALLTPFTGQLQRAMRLRVLGSSALAGIPVHALPWADDIVLAAMPVVHGLDLPRAREPPAGTTAVVIADPSGNLAHARAEAESVATMLRAQGWQVQAPGTVSRAVMHAALAEADLLHYAGHGRSEGVSGWDSVLVLADDSTLGVGDILALPRVPPAVVLSGCETGASDAHALAGGMNLGRAFLLAGAHTVIVASGTLDDAVAAAVGAELYREWRPDRPFDGPAALRRALLKVRAADPSQTGWQQLHALAP